MGRPKIQYGNYKIQIYLCVDKDKYKRFKEIVKNIHSSVGQQIGELIEDFVEEHDRER